MTDPTDEIAERKAWYEFLRQQIELNQPVLVDGDYIACCRGAFHAQDATWRGGVVRSATLGWEMVLTRRSATKFIAEQSVEGRLDEITEQSTLRPFMVISGEHYVDLHELPEEFRAADFIGRRIRITTRIEEIDE